MTVDYNIQTLWEWLAPSASSQGALLQFLMTIAVIALLGVILGYLGSATRYGFQEGFYRLAMVVVNAPTDLIRMSGGRVLAMAKLAIQEAIRRRVLVVFAIFVLVLLVAGWYLDQKNDRPAVIYLSFVLTAANFLIILVALFISAFSLPNDIKNRTIYTVVTKPVRSSEIVLGRVLGFIVVGTGLLVMMGAISYVFVVRGLSHGHTVVADSIGTETIDGKEMIAGELDYQNHHSHKFTFDPKEGLGRTDTKMQHWHVIEKQGDEYVVGPPEGLPPVGRVPVYGKLRFLTRSGAEGEGVSVGYEWAYRKYVEGGTLAAAIFTFDDINEVNYPEGGLPLELNISVFRTYKGDIERGVVGEIILRNPDTSAAVRTSTPITFTSKEFEIDEQFIPRKLSAISVDESRPVEVDLFDDLAPDGKLEVIVRCAERAQYFGVAQADVYLKAAEQPFISNFIKGYAGIWMQMVIVICLGVMFSTFLSGPVAMLATIASVVMGVFAPFIRGVFGEQFESNPLLVRLLGTVADKGEGIVGGGPIESAIRLFSQRNLTIDMEFHPALLAIIAWIDLFLMGVLYTMTQALPNFRSLNRADNVANGFDISFHLLGQHGLTTVAYFVFLSIAGYFFLKTREIAA